jgi:hypothetical protein
LEESPLLRRPLITTFLLSFPPILSPPSHPFSILLFYLLSFLLSSSPLPSQECNFPSIVIHAGLKQEERIARFKSFKVRGENEQYSTVMFAHTFVYSYIHAFHGCFPGIPRAVFFSAAVIMYHI